MSPHDQDLRTTLRRLADASEPLPVDDDLWARAQAARRHGRVVIAAAVVAVLVAIGGGVALWQVPDREARTASQEVPGGAIPSRIDDPGELPAETDLAVGRASAAFVSAAGDPVVITATDGVAHRLDLGEWGPDRAAYALSPDGSRLAYQRPTGTGTRVTVLDLGTGRTEALQVHPDVQVEVDGLSWSPGGDWLGWVSSAVGSTRASAGTIRADGTEANLLGLARNASSIAVADVGDSVLGQVNGRLRLLPTNGPSQPLGSDVPAGVGAFSPDGDLLALGSGPARATYTYDLTSRRVLAHPFPGGTFGESVARPLGWVDDRLQLFLVQSTEHASAELVVTTPEVSATSTWRRSVGSVAATGVTQLSVAVDLVPDLDGTSSQELTHDFGGPTTTARTFLGVELSLAIGLGVAAAIALLLALRRLWRRFA